MVKVPGGQSLLLDAKVSLNAYQDAFGAVDEGEKTAHLAAHAAAMKAHVNALGAKSYWAQFPDTPDFVIMFVPGEHFLAAALDQDTALWDYAFERSEEQTSELQSLMRNSYAVFCLKKKKQ